MIAFTRQGRAKQRAAEAHMAMQARYSAAKGQIFRLSPDAADRTALRPEKPLDPVEPISIVIPEEDRRSIPPSRSSSENLGQAWRAAAHFVGSRARQGQEFAQVVLPVLRQNMLAAGAVIAKTGLRLAEHGISVAVEAPFKTLVGVAIAYFYWQGQHLPLPEAHKVQALPTVSTAAVTPTTRQGSRLERLLSPRALTSHAQAHLNTHAGTGAETGVITSNNPGNIVRSNIPWAGKVFTSESRFEKFATPQDGLNAMAQNLVSYGQRGLNTVAGIVGRWAPRHENNTAQYAARVAEEIGVQPTTPLNMGNTATLRSLMAAMIRQENSVQPFAPAMLDRAAALALGTATPERSYAAVSPNNGNLVSAVEICKTIVGMDATLTSGFAARLGEHDGIDCATSRGSAIVAIFGGVVQEKGYNGGYGNMVKICDGNVCGIYAHAEKFAPLRIGSVVKPGQEIAYVGNTGVVRGPTGMHTHYELRINDQPTNPSSLRGVLAMGLVSPSR